jgi:drug/metabolite transporter (DMT)-like permease
LIDLEGKEMTDDYEKIGLEEIVEGEMGVKDAQKSERFLEMKRIADKYYTLIIAGKELFKIEKKKMKYIIIAGLLGNFFPIFLFSLAQTQISSSISSTLNSFTPLNTLIIGSVFFGLTFKKKQIYGLLIGIIGCLILVYAGASGNPSKNYC